MRQIFRWSGEYVGFLDGPYLFGPDGRYLGWYQPDGSVWRADGRPLGQLVDGMYVLRDLRRAPPVRQCARVPPVPKLPPPPPGPQLPRVPRPAWADALYDIGRPPSEGDLRGRWCAADACLELTPEGRFRWIGADAFRSAGSWQIDAWVLQLHVQDGDAAPARLAFRIIALETDTLVLRREVEEGRSLPVTLRRLTPDMTGA